MILPSEIDNRVRKEIEYNSDQVDTLVRNSYNKNITGLFFKAENKWMFKASLCATGAFLVATTGLATPLLAPLLVGMAVTYPIALIKGSALKKEKTFVLNELQERIESGNIPVNQTEVKQFLREAKENYELDGVFSKSKIENTTEKIYDRVRNAVKNFKENFAKGVEESIDNNPKPPKNKI